MGVPVVSQQMESRAQRAHGCCNQLQVIELRKHIQGNPPVASESDEIIWRWEKYGNFMVSSTYRHCIDGGHRLPQARHIQRIKCPIKIRAFLWLIAKENLQRNGWKGPRVYVLCRLDTESSLHIFLMCAYTAKIQEKYAARLHIVCPKI